VIPNPYPGSFFAFEGIDGSGKSTQFKLATQDLEEKLHSHGYAGVGKKVVTTKEPRSERFWGAHIYDDLFRQGGLHSHNLFGFQTWFALDSRDNYREVIIPALTHGKIVLSDRSRASMVFGAQTPLQIPELMRMNMSIIGPDFIWPDAIFIFDIDPEKAVARCRSAERRLDGHENIETLSVVRENYIALARDYPNCHLVNAESTPAEIFEHVRGTIYSVIDSKK